jgi:hypothetical protein
VNIDPDWMQDMMNLRAYLEDNEEVGLSRRVNQWIERYNFIQEEQ